MPIGATSKGRTSSATSVATTGVTTTTGSAFLAIVGMGGTQTFSSISDTINGSASGNTWTQIGSEVTFPTDRCRAYYVQNGNGGANHVVTVTVSGAVAITVLLVELTGVLTASVLDGSSLVADAASPFTSGNVATTQADEILVAGIIGASGSNPATHAISSASPASGWTIQTSAEETNGASFFTGAIATQTVSATGTYNGGFTESGASNAAVLLAAFKLAAAAPTINTQPTNQRVEAGSTASYSVSATASGGSLSYQWQSNASGSFVDISGETASTYTTGTLPAGTAYAVRCVVTDSNGSKNSDPADAWTPAVAPPARAGYYGKGGGRAFRFSIPTGDVNDAIFSDALFGTPSGAAFTYTAAGGFSFAGAASADFTRAYAATGSGGFTFAGAATALEANNYSATGAGGLTFGGAATAAEANDYTASGSGGITFGGVADAQIDIGFAFTGSGGLTFGGAATAIEANDYAMTAAGGLAFGGAATTLEANDYVAAGAGGITFAGAASTVLEVGFVVSGSGGVTFGGAATALEANNYAATGSGGIVFGGAADAVPPDVVTAAGESSRRRLILRGRR